jgi:hypothetical protein
MKVSHKPILFAALGSFFLAFALTGSAWAQNNNTRPARPGSINYVEGQASIGGQTLGSSSAGSAELQAGQTLTTQTGGKVEILLTPGVFLRVGDNTAVKMISPDLANTEVELDKGEAMVEVSNISKNNNIRIDENGANIQLVNKGLYDFDSDNRSVRVFKGKAEVHVNNQNIKLGDNRQITLVTGGKLKSEGFDTKQYADDLYRWSGLRSGYLAEADADTARLYVNGGAGWSGSGWYWDPWFSAYTFIPGDGIFYSPFGWGYYSPFAIYGSPYFYGGYYGHPHAFGDIHGPYGHGFEPQGGFRGGFRGGFGGGVFHGGGSRGGGRR